MFINHLVEIFLEQSESPDYNLKTSMHLVVIDNLNSNHRIVINNPDSKHHVITDSLNSNHHMIINNLSSQLQIIINNLNFKHRIVINNPDYNHRLVINSLNIKKNWVRKIYTVIKHLFKTTRYVKNKKKLLTKILAVGKSAMKFRYFRFLNQIIFYRDRHLSWIRPPKEKIPFGVRKLKIWKKYGGLRFMYGRKWVLKTNSLDLPLFRYKNKVGVRREFFDLFRFAAWRSKRTFYKTYRGIIRNTSALVQKFKKKQTKEKESKK